MKLADYQQTFARMCLDAQPDEADVQALGGDLARWRMYRRMVRSRLLKMAKVAFGRSARLLADERFEGCHDRFLAGEGPRSPFIREVVARFGAFALEDAALDASAYERDVWRFELAKWELGYLQAELPLATREFDFEGVPVLHPVVRVLELGFAVHHEAADETQAAEPTGLLLYRPEGASGVRWWTLDAFGAALLRSLQAGTCSVPDAVRASAAQTGETLDAALLERLSGLLALAVERGVLLGSRDA